MKQLHATVYIHTSKRLYSISTTHFLSRKTKLKKRKTIVMMIPQVARTPSITVTAMCTVTVSSSGTPSYGIPSTDRQENEQYVMVSFQAIQTGLRMRPKYVLDDMYCINSLLERQRRRDGATEKLKAPIPQRFSCICCREKRGLGF